MPFTDVAATIQALPQEKQSVFQHAAARLHRNNVTQEASQGPKLATNQDSNFALLQNQNNQDKAQPAMSPTDRFAGRTATQGASQSPAAAKTPAPSQTPAPMPTPSVSRGGGGRGR